MPINTGIPDNLILPLAHFCIDTDQGPRVRSCCPALFLAPMLDTGTAEPGVPHAIASCGQAQEFFGAGSVAADMACFYLLNNRFGELFITGLEDFGNPATACITVDAPPTGSGNFYVRIADHAYYVPVFPGDTEDDIAQALVTFINNDQDAPFTATFAPGTGKATIVSKNGGDQANTIPICVNSLFGEEDPQGLEYTIDEFAGGSGTYGDQIELALANLGECCYDFIGVPFCDTSTHDLLENEIISRWQCDRLIGGRWYATCCDTFTNHLNRLDAVNYQFGSLIMCCPGECYIPWRETAAYVGRAHLQTCLDPSQAWYSLPLLGIRCSVDNCDEDCFERSERNILALNGGSTNICGNNGIKIIELETSVGATSIFDVWRYPQSAYQTIRFMRQLQGFVAERFRGVRIVDDIDTVQEGDSAVTPTVIVSIIRDWAAETQGDILDNVDNLNNFIEIERNVNNPFRIDMCINIDLANALRVLAIKIRPSLTATLGNIDEADTPTSTV